MTGVAPPTAGSHRFSEALDGIVFRAVLSFVGVASITAVPLLLQLSPNIHAAAHAVLPAVWVVYAGFVWVRTRGQPTPPQDPWPEAWQADPRGARAARIAVVGLPIGWLAAALGLLMHHLSTSAGTLEVIGIDTPLLAVGWWLGQWAWRVSCRKALIDARRSTAAAGARR